MVRGDAEGLLVPEWDAGPALRKESSPVGQVEQGEIRQFRPSLDAA
jgi:hypothetical protein